MTLDPTTEARLSAKEDAVLRVVQAAIGAPDLAAKKAAWNRAWFAIHEAQEAINEADRITRQAALAKLENVA